MDGIREEAHPARTEPILPAGSGLALIGAAMMAAGALGPWIGGRFFGTTPGIALGGDGWLVVAAALLALVPVVLPLAGPAARGAWVTGFGLVGAFVCWTHYTEARADGVEVVWGLELAAIGCALLVLAGLRGLLDQRAS